MVFAFDEKSQIRALDRTQPGLPLKRGRAGTWTHDYKRHGTTTLFAVLEVATGRIIQASLPRHRHQELHRPPQHHSQATGLDCQCPADPEKGE